MSVALARRLVVPAAMSLAVTLSAACSRRPPDSSPEGAVRLFLDEIDAAGDDPPAVRRAYDLLGPAARANLTERARRASRLQGRHLDPWDMIAAGLFGLAFRPKAMHAAGVVGDRATVEVVGEDPQTSHASVACVQEAGGWRVEPGLPEP